MSELPRPDDAADALAIATWAANTERVGPRDARRARHGPGGRRADRPRRDVGYERAVREALAAERAADAAHAKRTRPRRSAAMIASVEGTVGAVALDSLVIEVGGIGYRVFAAPAILAAARSRAAGSSSTRTTSSARTSRRCTASAPPRSSASSTLLLTVTGVGPKVALAIVGSRPDAGPPARDHAPGPGGPRRRSRGSARSSPSGSSSSSRRR